MPSYPALRCTLPYFLLLGIATYILLSSSCSEQNQQIGSSVIQQQDSVAPSQVTILADLPDSLQPETTNLADVPAPATIPIVDKETIVNSLERSKTNEIVVHPSAITKMNFSPDLQQFTAEQGLAMDAISCGYIDKKGILWFGTFAGGISKYDGKSFTTYTTTNGLLGEMISDLIEDRHGNMWFATNDGIFKFDGTTFSTFGNFKIPLCLLEDKAGNIWIGTHTGTLYKCTGDSITQFTESDGLTGSIISAIREDKNGILWIGNNLGIHRYDGKNFKLLDIDIKDVEGMAIDRIGNVWACNRNGYIKYDGSKSIRFPLSAGNHNIYTDQAGNILLATDKDGVWCYNEKSMPSLYKYVDFRLDNVRCMIEDHSGNLWIGTNGKGIYKYSGKAFQQVLPNSIRSIMEDKSGNIWLGGYYIKVTLFNGIHFTSFGPELAFWSLLQDRSGRIWMGSEANGLFKFVQNEFTVYTDLHGLPGLAIKSIMQDEEGNFWIGTDKGLSKFNGTAFTNFTKKQGLAGKQVNNILEYKPGNFFIGTDSGLSTYNGVSFSNYHINAAHGGNDIRSMKKDQYGNLWLGTYGGGLTRYDGKTFHTYTVENGLPDNVVTQVALTKEGYIITGTNNGIAILTGFVPTPGVPSNNESSSGSIEKYPPQNNFSNKTLMDYNPVFEIYNPQTGYPVSDVNRGDNTILEDSKGFLWIASGSEKSGLIRFDYSSLSKNLNPPQLNILSVKVGNELVCWNNLMNTEMNHQQSVSRLEKINVSAIQSEEVITFGQTLNKTQRDKMKAKYKGLKFDGIRKFYPIPENLVLPYRHNNITVEFAAIEPDKPALVQYQYMLEGYHENWSTPANITSATFGNIYEGSYKFLLKARSPSGIWCEPITYSFTILPPWYRTWWAYLLYILLLVGLMYEIINFFRRRLQLHHQLKAEQDEAIRLKELDTFKSQLFTNLTHEFRTPLTVILGMAKQLSGGTWNSIVASNEKARISQGLKMIENNGKNLLQLINQLLDLSKLENKSFKLQNIQGDIIPYLRYVTESFQSYAEDIDLSIRFVSEINSLMMDFDPEQMKQILTNLISNALKFTPSGGEVIVNASLSEGQLSINVSDTGIGISEKDLPYVMDRFYQADSSTTRVAQGTGIGLAHTQELLKVMGGNISLKSEVGKGTSITVLMPISHEATIIEEEIVLPATPYLSLTRTNADTITDVTSSLDQQPSSNENIPQLLIIEDNRDVVEYLKSCLEDRYRIRIAYNGKAGVEKALEEIPDFIISDVMMPEMDGFQVCNALKNDERTSHIPIILLTAKADAASRLAGLRRGADAYMAKPFNPEELHIHISMLLENRRRMAAHFSKLLQSGTSPVTEESNLPEVIQFEDAFMKKVHATIEDHYTDEYFSLPELCQYLNMSRSQLFRKMKAVADIAPSDLIRSYRLNKARTLLEQGDFTVAEVAYKVGFKDPSYFSKMFQEEFGVQPSAVIKL